MRSAVLLLIAGSIACGDDGSEARSVLETPAQHRARLAREEALEVQEAAQRKMEIRRMEREQLEAERQAGIVEVHAQRPPQVIDPTRLSLVLDVGDTGTVVIAGDMVSDDELETIFRAAYDRERDTQVVIRAGRNVAHGRVVKLMELAKAVGLTRLAIGAAAAPPIDP